MTNIEEKAEILVGVPVHNGARSLSRCLSCLKNQSFQNFKVVIFENCSTDNTVEIAKSFTEQDPRFTISPSDTFLTAFENHNRAREFCSNNGRYFCLRAHDDYSGLDFLEKLHAALEAKPHCLLAGPSCTLVYDDGSQKKCLIPDSVSDPKRFISGFNVHPKMQISTGLWYYGLYRGGETGKIMTQIYARLPSIWAADNLLVLSFILKGQAVSVKDTTFFYGHGGPSLQYIAKTFSDRVQCRIIFFRSLVEFSEAHMPKSPARKIFIFYKLWQISKMQTGYFGKWLFFGRKQMRHYVRNKLI